MIKRTKEFIKKNYIWVIFAISIIVFLAILEDVFESDILKCDQIAYYIVMNYLRMDWLTPIVKGITMLGSAGVLITICVVTLILEKNKKIGLLISGNLVGITILNLILKNIVQRPRPEGYRLISETGYSFPSGHSMVSTAFYGLIIYILYKNVKNKTLRNILCILISILILLIGTSRIYLGVHYASDVIAGFFTSIAYLIVLTTVIFKIKKGVSKNEKINK